MWQTKSASLKSTSHGEAGYPTQRRPPTKESSGASRLGKDWGQTFPLLKLLLWKWNSPLVKSQPLGWVLVLDDPETDCLPWHQMLSQCCCGKGHVPKSISSRFGEGSTVLVKIHLTVMWQEGSLVQPGEPALFVSLFVCFILFFSENSGQTGFPLWKAGLCNWVAEYVLNPMEWLWLFILCLKPEHSFSRIAFCWT